MIIFKEDIMDTQTMENIRRLKLSYIADNFDSFVNGCDKSNLPAKSVIERLCNLEVARKDRPSGYRTQAPSGKAWTFQANERI